MTEQTFTNELLKWFKVYKWLVFHVRNSGHGGNTYVQGDKGFIDILAVKGSRWIAAELKVGKAGTLKGDPTPAQAQWLEALKNVGAETYVWHPENWSEILVVLSK
jgi:hypothetical protein